jgi:hypothetical protein
MEMDNTEIVAEIRRIISAYFDYAKLACENSDNQRAIGHIEDGIADLRKLTDRLE